MKRILGLVMAVAVMVSVTSCRKTVFCIKGQGSTTTEIRSLEEFEEVEIDIPAKVYLIQDENISSPEITIEAQGNIIDNINTYVSGDKLKVKFNDCVRNHDQITIHLKVADLHQVYLNGSGDIVTENILTTSHFEAVINGSGDMHLAVNAPNVKAKINGSGDIFAKGVAENFDVNVNGSGKIEAFKLITQNGDVKITGSGDVEIYSEQFLKVYINGSGNVYYKGYPSMDVQISGSGKVINAN